MVRLVLWFFMGSILKNAPCVLDMNLYSPSIKWNVLYNPVLFHLKYGSNPVFPYYFSFCLDDLSIAESWILNSPIIIELLSISPFSSISICLIYLGIPILDEYIFMIVMFLMNWLLYHWIMTAFVSCYHIWMFICLMYVQIQLLSFDFHLHGISLPFLYSVFMCALKV